MTGGVGWSSGQPGDFRGLATSGLTLVASCREPLSSWRGQPLNSKHSEQRFEPPPGFVRNLLIKREVRGNAGKRRLDLAAVLKHCLDCPWAPFDLRLHEPGHQEVRHFDAIPPS